MAEGSGGTGQPRRGGASFARDDDSGVDLLRAVRERPLLALGAVFGAGVLLALVSGRGGEDEEEVESVKVPEPLDPEARAALWERRARRLQRIAREQEAELTRLRRKGAAARDSRDEDSEDDEESGGGLAELFRAGLQRIVRSAGADD